MPTKEQIQKVKQAYNEKNKSLLIELQAVEKEADREIATLNVVMANMCLALDALINNQATFTALPFRPQYAYLNKQLTNDPAKALSVLALKGIEKIRDYDSNNMLDQKQKEKYSDINDFFKEIFQIFSQVKLPQDLNFNYINHGRRPILARGNSRNVGIDNQSRLQPNDQESNQSRLQPNDQESNQSRLQPNNNVRIYNQNQNGGNNRGLDRSQPAAKKSNAKSVIEVTDISSNKEDLVFRFTNETERDNFVQKLESNGVYVCKNNLKDQCYRGVGIYDDNEHAKRSLYISLRKNDKRLLLNSEHVNITVGLINPLLESENKIRGKKGRWVLPESVDTKNNNKLTQNTEGEFIANDNASVVNNYYTTINNNRKTAISVAVGAAATGAGVGITIAKSVHLFTLVAGVGLFASPLIAKAVALAAVAAVVLVPAVVAGLGAYGIYKGVTTYQNKKKQKQQNSDAQPNTGPKNNNK